MQTNSKSSLQTMAIRVKTKRANNQPTDGLPEAFFSRSSLVPIVNIDLFVTNSNREVLFSWRSDLHHGKGWHIPGGCVRLKETLLDRVEKQLLVNLELLFIIINLQSLCAKA